MNLPRTIAFALCLSCSAAQGSDVCNAVPVSSKQACTVAAQELLNQKKWDDAFDIFDAVYQTGRRLDYHVGIRRALAACRIAGKVGIGRQWLTEFMATGIYRDLPKNGRDALTNEERRCVITRSTSERVEYVGSTTEARFTQSYKSFFYGGIGDGPPIPFPSNRTEDPEIERSPQQFQVFDANSVEYWLHKANQSESGSRYSGFTSGGIVFIVPDKDAAAKLKERSDVARRVRQFSRHLNDTFGMVDADRPIALLLTKNRNVRELAEVAMAAISRPHEIVGATWHERLVSVAWLQRPYLGTVLHEYAHQRLLLDFPGQPYWLEEGIAMLYEQAEFKNNRFVGLPNWRMNETYSNGYRSLQVLLAGSDSSLYEASCQQPYDTSDFSTRVHLGKLADIRTLVLWLQQQGKLGQVYQSMRAAASEKGVPLLPAESLSILLKETGKSVTDIERAIGLQGRQCDSQ